MADKLPAEGTPLVGTPVKQGHICCGGCCDVRRAVIIINIISLVFAVLGAFGVTSYFVVINNDYDDDQTQDYIDQVKEDNGGNTPVYIMYGIVVFRIIVYSCGIYGAKNFKAGFVAFTGIMYAIGVIASAISLDIVSVIAAALFTYPHYFLYKEIKDGIMSEENYENEKQSCCCV